MFLAAKKGSRRVSRYIGADGFGGRRCTGIPECAHLTPASANLLSKPGGRSAEAELHRDISFRNCRGLRLISHSARFEEGLPLLYRRHDTAHEGIK